MVMPLATASWTWSWVASSWLAIGGALRLGAAHDLALLRVLELLAHVHVLVAEQRLHAGEALAGGHARRVDFEGVRVLRERRRDVAFVALLVADLEVLGGEELRAIAAQLDLRALVLNGEGGRLRVGGDDGRSSFARGGRELGLGRPARGGEGQGEGRQEKEAQAHGSGGLDSGLAACWIRDDGREGSG